MRLWLGTLIAFGGGSTLSISGGRFSAALPLTPRSTPIRTMSTPAAMRRLEIASRLSTLRATASHSPAPQRESHRADRRGVTAGNFEGRMASQQQFSGRTVAGRYRLG